MADDSIEQRLDNLRTEHRDLDSALVSLAERRPFDPLQLQRLKKKLILKDQIAELEDELYPDIIA